MRRLNSTDVISGAEVPRSIPSTKDTYLRQRSRSPSSARGSSHTYTDRSRARSRSPRRVDSYKPSYDKASRRESRSSSRYGHHANEFNLTVSKAAGTSSHRSGSPNSQNNGNCAKCNPRSLISYADIDSNPSQLSPHTVRPRYVSMEESSSLDYYEFNKDEFKPGVIIRAPIHEEDFRRTPPSVSNHSIRSRERSHVSHTDFGAVYSENRLFLVVEQFNSHYLAVPLFTYQGTGLRKEHHDAKEYASIEDHRYPGSSLRAAPHLLVTEKLKSTVKPLKPESVAHLTYPVSRKYNLFVSYQGRLRDRDTELLLRLFRRRGSVVPQATGS